MASIYTERDSNIRRTYILFTVFFIAIIGIGWVFARAYQSPAILFVAVAFSSIMSVASYWYSDKIVLGLAKARPVEKSDSPELYRVVENLAITAGLPTPKIYIVDELAPNAFATGRDGKHAVVAVTTGLLRKLDKTELEGVIAHELSHIGNRDMLIGTVAVVLVGFVSLLANFFLRANFFSRRSNDREGNANNVFFLIGIALSIIAPIAMTLMRLAISRRRESLADASGALLTRYPEGLASALQKIASDGTPLRVAANTTAHLWLADPFQNSRRPWLQTLFMTHPPIEDRIKALREMSL